MLGDIAIYRPLILAPSYGVGIGYTISAREAGRPEARGGSSRVPHIMASSFTPFEDQVASLGINCLALSRAIMPLESRRSEWRRG